MAFIRTVYQKDGTIKREIVGVKGEDCLKIAEPFNRHLPEGYQLTPTAEFYEEPATEQERNKETQ